MISAGKKYDEVRVVNDQIGTPTYTYDLARFLVDMCETGENKKQFLIPRGFVHGSLVLSDTSRVMEFEDF